MGRFAYRPLQNYVDPGPGAGAQIAAGFSQGVDNYLGARQRGAEDKLRRDELARQREREAFLDELSLAEGGWEQGGVPNAGVDIFSPGPAGQQPRLGMQAAGPPKARGPYAPGPAASLFGGTPRLDRPPSIGGTIEFNDPQSESGLLIQAPQRSSRPAPGLLDQYAQSGPDADYIGITSGDRAYHRLRPEIAQARASQAARAASMEDYQAKSTFDRSQDDAAEAADLSEQDATFNANLSPAVAALVKAHAGLTEEQAANALTAQYTARRSGMSATLSDFLPPEPDKPQVFAPQRDIITDGRTGEQFVVDLISGRKTPLGTYGETAAATKQIGLPTFAQALEAVKDRYGTYDSATSSWKYSRSHEEMQNEAQRMAQGGRPDQPGRDALDIFRNAIGGSARGRGPLGGPLARGAVGGGPAPGPSSEAASDAVPADSTAIRQRISDYLDAHPDATDEEIRRAATGRP